MIYIDDRIGSKELYPYFRSGAAELTRLQYGDLMFTGNGPDEIPYRIGIERKRIRDLISSMSSNRLVGHQLIGMKNSYNVIYLIIEGVFRPNPDSGVLETYGRQGWSPPNFGVSRRRFMARDILAFLNTLVIKDNIHVIRTATKSETAITVSALQYWWTCKEFEAHKAHHQEYVPEAVVLTGRVGLARRVAMALPGIGWELSDRIRKRFETAEEMVNASIEDWMGIEGIGQKTAETIWLELRGVS